MDEAAEAQKFAFCVFASCLADCFVDLLFELFFVIFRVFW